MNIDIMAVELLGGTRLRLTFANGERRDVDIAALVRFEGVFAPLADAEYFKSVRVAPEYGTIVWPDGADLCPDVLYESSEAVMPAGRLTA